MKDFQVDSMPLKEFRKFLQFLIKLKDERFKENHFYYKGERIAFIYSVYAGKKIKEDNIIIEICMGLGSKKGLSISEKREKAEEIYRELYGKFKHGY
jgi:hypothetical protein